MNQEDAKPNDQSWPEEAVFMQRQQDTRVQNTIISATASLISYLEGHTTKAEIVNQLSEIGTPDVSKVVDALNALHDTLKTHENTDLTEITKVMQDLLDEVKKIPKELPEEKEQPFVDYTKQFASLVGAVQAVEKVVKQQKLIAEAPVINVPEAIVHVDKPDLDPLQHSIRDVVDAVKGIIVPEYKTDNKDVEKLLTKANKLLTQILDKPVRSGGGGGGGRATPYQDASGIPAFVTLTAGAVPVSGTFTSTLPAGAATSAKQDTGNVSLASIDSKITTVDTGATVISSSALPTGASTAAKQDTGNTSLASIDSKITAVNTGAVVISSGSLTANIGTTNGLALDATITGGTQQSKITDGTNIGGILKNDGTIASTQNAQIVTGTGYTTSTISLSAGTQNTSWYDMLNYAWVSVEILTNTTPATLTFQTSGDASQTNVSSVQLHSSSGTAYSSTTTSATATFHGPRTGRYFRIASNLAGGNTATLVLTFFTNSSVAPGTYVTQTGTWNVGSSTATGATLPANAFLVGIKDGSGLLQPLQSGGHGANTSGITSANAVMLAEFDDVSPTAITENQFGNVRMSTNRNLYGTIRDAAGNERGVNVTATNALVVDGSAVTQPVSGTVTANTNLAPSGTILNTYSTHLISNTTTTPTSSTAYISTVTISSEVAGTTSTVTIQDKQGTPLKLVNGFSTTTLTTTPTVVNFQTPVKMTSGIDIITAGAVAATIDIWINYYQ